MSEEAQESSAGANVATTKPVDQPFKDKLNKLINILPSKGKNLSTSSLAEKEAQQFYGHLKDQKKMDLGLIGWLIGHGIEKLGNIAFLVILASFGIIIFLIWKPLPDDSVFREKTTSTLFSIITLSLGYLFGKTTSKKDPE